MQVQIVYFLAPTHLNSLSYHQHKIIKHSYTNKRWSLFVSLLRKTSARLLLITHTAEVLLNIKRNQVLKWSNAIYDAAGRLWRPLHKKSRMFQVKFLYLLARNPWHNVDRRTKSTYSFLKNCLPFFYVIFQQPLIIYIYLFTFHNEHNHSTKTQQNK